MWPPSADTRRGTPTEQALPAGQGYVYFVHELDAQQRPLPGRTVTMSAGTVPGPDATVAPSDRGGHLTGTPGKTATEQSDADGEAYFVVRTSTTPGQNQFTWSDTAYGGQVLVTGLPPASPTARTAPAAGPAHIAGTPPNATRTAVIPPLAAGIAATAVIWLVAPTVIARRRRRAAADAEPVPSLDDRLPMSS